MALLHYKAWTGTVGFNPKPQPHSTPFWDDTADVEHRLTKVEYDYLTQVQNLYGSSILPPFVSLKRLRELDDAYIIVAPPGYDVSTQEYLRKKTESEGVWNNLKPRSGSNAIMNIRTDVVAQAYYPVHFPASVNYRIWVPGQRLSKDQIKRKLIHYPDIPNLLMKAPLFLSPNFRPLPTPVVNTRNGLTHFARFLARSPKEVTELIFEELNHNDRATFQAVCLETAHAISNFGTLWDVGGLWFHNAEYSEEEFQIMQRNGQIPPEDERRGAKYLTVSNGYAAWDNGLHGRPHYTYARQAHGLGRMLRAFKLVGNTIRDLTLCGVTFLDYRVMTTICRECRGLQIFRAFKNENFRFHELVQFLEYIKTEKKHVKFDIAPAYESGPRFSNFNSAGEQASTHRKGTFGVSHTDCGLKTQVALAKHFLYDFAPALYAADQMHMVEDPTSLNRGWWEAQAAPPEFHPRLSAVFHARLRLDQDIAEEEKIWRARTSGRHAGGPRQDSFEKRFWPEQLHRKVTLSTIQTNMLLLISIYGEEGWIETSDRAFHASDFRASLRNYALWGQIYRCVHCNTMLPRFFFGTSWCCEDCRLKNYLRTEEKGHHLIKKKGDAIDVLRFPRAGDFLIWDPASGVFVPRIQRPIDFLVGVLDVPFSVFSAFMDAARLLDARDAIYRTARRSTAQRDHREANNPPAALTAMSQILRYKMYRRALTKEEFLLCGAKGWTPQRAKANLFW